MGQAWSGSFGVRAVCLIAFCAPHAVAIFQSSAHVQRICEIDCRYPSAGTATTTIHLMDVDRCIRECKADAQKSSEILWTYFNSVFVFMMQIGFAFLEAGSCREIHRNFLLRKNVMDALLSPLCFWATTYIFKQDLFFDEQGHRKAHTILFQALFGATSVTIASGAIAERIRLSAYYFYVFIMSGFVYPLVMMGAWDPEYDGWPTVPFRFITDHPYHDAAGSGVVHLLGGTSGLVAACLLGFRIWRPPPLARGLSQSRALDKGAKNWIFKGEGKKYESWAKKEEEVFYPDVGKQVIGTFLLGVGWFGFNAGSVRFELAGTVALNTLLAWCTAGVASYIYYYFERAWGKMESVPWGGVCNGSLCGLVAVTAGCDVATDFMAVVCGLAAGLLCPIGCGLVQRWVDDTVDASMVHAGGGFIGLLFVAVLKPDCSQDLGESPERFCGEEHSIGLQFLAQLLGAAAIFVWAVLWSVPMWSPFILAECCKAYQFDLVQKRVDDFIKEHQTRREKQDIAVIRAHLPHSYVTEWLMAYLRDNESEFLSPRELKKAFYPGFHDEYASVCRIVTLCQRISERNPCYLRILCCFCRVCTRWGCFSLWASFRNSPKEELEGLSMELNNVLPTQCKRLFQEHSFWRRHSEVKAKADLKMPRKWTICGASVHGLFLALRLAQVNDLWKTDTIHILLLDDALENVPGDPTKYRFAAKNKDRNEAVITPDPKCVEKIKTRRGFRTEDEIIFSGSPEGDRVCDMQDRLLQQLLGFKSCVKIEAENVSTHLKEKLEDSHVVVMAEHFSCFEEHGIRFAREFEDGVDYMFSYNFRGEVFPQPEMLRALNYAQTKFFLQSSATVDKPPDGQEVYCTVYFRVSQDQWEEWEKCPKPRCDPGTGAVPFHDPEIEKLAWPKREVMESLEYFFPKMTWDKLPETITPIQINSGKNTTFHQVYKKRTLCTVLGEDAMGCLPMGDGGWSSGFKAADALAVTWIDSVKEKGDFLGEIEGVLGFENYAAALADEELTRVRPWVQVQPPGKSHAAALADEELTRVRQVQPPGKSRLCGAVVGGRTPSVSYEKADLEKNVLGWLRHERGGSPPLDPTDEEVASVRARIDPGENQGLSDETIWAMNDACPAGEDDLKGWSIQLLHGRQHNFLDEPWSL